ncbi:hypothetical protein LZ641_09810 [Hafnia paralvei]|uniref:hypothetical protein n=1 Tax=Hafnia paralvei TaxID=546367 RepID=UPI001F28891A|nr:hypothetical protein [Hafnia paralvei]MCE9880635.1 hypothetical protein [Hafnia paralvei]MCE9906166.1 hypothetical protein [Hafnia paralvei]MCE9910473.1 hypothetical protein [Hafnia paralvei]
MHKDAYWLINHFPLCSLQDAQDLGSVAEDVETAMFEGISSIGNLMFWAGASEDYDGDEAKRDIRQIGSMLKHLSRLTEGVSTASQNFEHAVRTAERGTKS